MQDLVDEGDAQTLDRLALLRIEVAHGRERPLELLLAQGLELLAQRHDRGHDVEAREPAPEGVDLRLDDRLGLGRRRGTRSAVVGDDTLQVVDVVEVDAIEGVHPGIDRARDGEVDHEHRTASPLA